MKFSCSQIDFASKLATVSRAVPTRPSHPVLACILFGLSGNQLTLTGFDLSVGVELTLDVAGEVNGSLAVPAKLLCDVVSRLPAGDIEFSVVAEDDSITLEIVSGAGEYEVRAMSAEEYPQLPDIQDKQEIELPSDLLREGLASTLFCVSTDESKQVLTGVHILLQDQSLEFASTDGHRMSKIVVPSESEHNGESLGITVPGKALNELNRMIQSTRAQSVKLSFDQGILECTIGTQRLTTRLLEGQYPNYNQLIPVMFSKVATIDRTPLVAALERVSVFAIEKNGVVVFSFDEDAQDCTIQANASEVGGGLEELPLVMLGDSIAIAFNVKYLLDGLKAMSTDAVTIEMNSPTSPVVISPVGGQLKHLVMPVHIREAQVDTKRKKKRGVRELSPA